MRRERAQCGPGCVERGAHGEVPPKGAAAWTRILDGAIAALKKHGLEALPPLGLVLGSGLGAVRRRGRGRGRRPLQRASPAFPLPSVAGHAGGWSSARSRAGASRCSRAAATTTSAATPRCASRSRRSSASAARRCCSPTPPAACTRLDAAGAGGDHRPHQFRRRQSADRPAGRRPLRAADPGLRPRTCWRRCAAPRETPTSSCTRASTCGSPARASRRRPRSARRRSSAPISSACRPCPKCMLARHFGLRCRRRLAGHQFRRRPRGRRPQPRGDAGIRRAAARRQFRACCAPSSRRDEAGTRMMLPQEIIRAKRDGRALERERDRRLHRRPDSGAVSEGQAAAFAMAVFFRGMTLDERVALTARDDALGRDARLARRRPARPGRRQAFDRRRRRQRVADAGADARRLRRLCADDLRARPRPYRRHARQARFDPRLRLAAGPAAVPPRRRARPAARSSARPPISRPPTGASTPSATSPRRSNRSR